ncbi:SCO6880 family protein [Gordonia pseudamarae]|jgi:hypothetical protein|uniref:SCO6880 family protein n=1 Tax=Gordonia pseudamarae TaxID=2831662 RepID=UPI001AF7F8BB|nr:SCO6880 family protein [Gordonia pseudamarae]QHN28970.1 hypothetical protein GII33_23085 [Gordonia pseudamarae]
MTSNNAVLLYGRWEKPRSSGLFGMTWGATMFCGGVVIAAILVLMFFQSVVLTGAVLVFGALVIGPMLLQRRGRTAWELMIVKLKFWGAQTKGENIFRGGVFGVIPGRSKMPGIQGHTELYEYELRTGQRFGLIHSPAKDHYTVVLASQPQGQELVEQSQINSWVRGWDDFLAGLGTTHNVAGAVVVVETVPDRGTRIAAEVRAIVSPDAPDFAREVMAQTVTHRRSATVRNEVRIAITFRRQREADSREVGDQGVAIGRLLSTIINRAAHAGLDASPMTAADLCAVATRSFRPEVTHDIELLQTRGEHDSLRWDDTGCTGAKALWDSYVHNGYRSVTWEMAAAPAGTVTHAALRPLLVPRADIPRKRVAIVYRIHNIGEAVKLVDNDFKDALNAESGKKGVSSASASIRVDNTRAAREEQARGAGLTRFGMLITLTAPLDADLPQLSAEIEGMSSAARIGVQRVFGGQDAAFAGSLGLGILLPEYAVVNKRLTI